LKQKQPSNRFLQQLLKHDLPYETLTTKTEKKQFKTQTLSTLTTVSAIEKKLGFMLLANNGHCYDDKMNYDEQGPRNSLSVSLATGPTL